MRSMHKKFLVVLFLPFVIAAGATAETVHLPRLAPVDPSVIAQGGSYVAVAEGYPALFTNPAGFRLGRGSLTLLSTSAWLHARPDVVVDDIRALPLGEPSSILTMLEHQYQGVASTSYDGNGMVGAGASAGIGWSGGGIGLGLSSTVEARTWGEGFPFGITGELQGGFDFVGGIAVPLNLLGMELSIGGDVRPIVRIYAPLTSATMGAVLSSLVSPDSDPLSALDAVPTLNGFGLAIDAGAIATLGPLNIGVSLRDLFGTRVSFAEHSFGAVYESLQVGALPAVTPDSAVSTDYRIPMSVSLGAAFHPNLGPLRHLVDPRVHAEVKDVAALFREDVSVWTRLHVGTELRILHVLKFRAGLNQGYFTVGAGVKLLFLDVNAAVFTQELGHYAGSKPSAGISVEAALRF